MTKKEVQQRVLQNGKPLDLKKFEWDKKARVFSTTESGLVLDFKGNRSMTFNTGWSCAFNTGSGCTFNTGWSCTFNTGSGCTFNTGSHCTFNTDSGCTFNTGSGCTFNTGWSCTFNTGQNCVVVRRDVYEVIELEEGVKTRLNGYGVKGYEVFNPKRIIKIDDKEIELSEESYQSLKSQLS